MTTTIKFHHIYENQDNINNIDEYIGTYFNQYNKSLDFVLYNKQKHLNILEAELTENNLKNDIKTVLPVKICSYSLTNSNIINSYNLEFVTKFPTINLYNVEAISDLQIFKLNNLINDNVLSATLSTKLLGSTVSGYLNISGEKISFDGNINCNTNIIENNYSDNFICNRIL